MSVTIPLYMTGRHVSLFTVTPETPNASGVLTPGTTVSLKTLGVFDHFRFQSRIRSEEISSADATFENYQPIKGSFNFEVGELPTPDGQSQLMNVYNANTYMRAACQETPPGGTAQYQIVCIGIFDTVDWDIVEGKSMLVARFLPCGIAPWYGTGVPPI